MTKIHVISGFLGAGKTTLIKKLIAEAFRGQKVVLIENEFGEIGVDGGFLKEAGIQITEMNSGCICCSLVGDFSRALGEVLEQYHPDQILIEPSGVGKLSDVVGAVAGVAEKHPVVLGGSVTVADAKKCKMYMKNFGEFYNNQVENARTIILSRTQELSEEKLAACVALLREHNADANIITTPWDQLSGEKILSVIEQQDDLAAELMKAALEDAHHHEEEECGCGHEHHHHHDGECCHGEGHHHHDGESCSCGHDHHHHHGHDADEVFTSWGVETPRLYTEEEIRQALEGLDDSNACGIVLRAKGIVPAADGRWIHFDYVPGESNVRFGSAEYTGRLCVIGSQLNEETLKKLFCL